MKGRKVYVYKVKKQPVFAVVKGILRMVGVLRKAKFVNFNDEVPSEGIFVGPHMWKIGPLFFSTYYPKKTAYVGAGQMLGTWKDRFLYLRDIYAIQKCHKKKFPATITAIFQATFSKFMYKGMHLIPSYEDIRLMHTLNDVKANMDAGFPVIIFPENSEKGYQLVMNELHDGYITIVKFLNKKRQKETPIYPFYMHKKRRYIAIGKPYYLSQFEGKSNEEINQYTKDRINELNPWLEEDKKNDPLYNQK